eukprot:TRINITY_DN16081_c0_g1_i1.p1 TRINITY_DN16081_c0_g1~~TRINITY_DN16081_c0_g1_i1.p1  ORF type:complete len:628 (+),score=55.99 TRINITY_DN16081_c0_g1_i1:62-1945(+)
MHHLQLQRSHCGSFPAFVCASSKASSERFPQTLSRARSEVKFRLRFGKARVSYYSKKRFGGLNSSSCCPSPSFLERLWKSFGIGASPSPSLNDNGYELDSDETELNSEPEAETQTVYYEREHMLADSAWERSKESGIPVYVMLPLNVVQRQGSLWMLKMLKGSFAAVRESGVEGIVMDVWWGLVEKDGPRDYDWSGYIELVKTAKLYDLKVKAVIAFHECCDDNSPNSAWIPLPDWVNQEIRLNPELAYRDKGGTRSTEYISLGCDMLPVLKGRSPIQVYSDFMRDFKETFSIVFGETITEIQVGMGPGGELRYPSFPLSKFSERFRGIGKFQCYDKYMRAHLKAYAEQIGKPEWAHEAPEDASHDAQWPDETTFFRRNGFWKDSYGQFFLKWYSEMLLCHGERICAAAQSIFRQTGVQLSAKIATIHWHYLTESHAAELTAGYYNTSLHNGYILIARMFGRHAITLSCSCFEMRDANQKQFSPSSSPEALLAQIRVAARKCGVLLGGSNSHIISEDSSYDQILCNSKRTLAVNNVKRTLEKSSVFEKAALEHIIEHSKLLLPNVICSFSFLRITRQFFHRDNFRLFKLFVKDMSNGNDAGADSYGRCFYDPNPQRGRCFRILGAVT